MTGTICSSLLCILLAFCVLTKGAPKAPNDTVSAFSLIMKANDNRGFSRDGVEMFQGDIVMTSEIKSELHSMGLYQSCPQNSAKSKKPKSKKPKRQKRAAMSNKAKRWMGSDRRPLIPYVIERSNSHARGVIQSAMRHWTQHVPCLRFVRRTSQRSYLSFFAGGGCYSHVGRTGGRQRISIGRGCEHLSVVVHEIGHALGFWHEQSRPDRDRYVKIYWNNILPQFKYAFHKYADGRINSLGVPYDYDSVMHYNSKAFGQGRTTITRINGDTRLGNSRGLSRADIKQARLLYCGSGGTPPTRPPRPTTRPPTGCSHSDLSSWCSYWFRQGYCSSSSVHYPYVSKNCKKTCFCKTPTLCEDKDSNCAAWSQSGYCKHTYKSYMNVYCRKSCKLCT